MLDAAPMSPSQLECSLDAPAEEALARLPSATVDAEASPIATPVAVGGRSRRRVGVAAVSLVGVVALLVWALGSGGAKPPNAYTPGAARAAGVAGQSATSAGPGQPPAPTTVPPIATQPAPTVARATAPSVVTSPVVAPRAGSTAATIPAPTPSGTGPSVAPGSAVGAPGVPAQVASVARAIIVAIDQQSGGRVQVPLTSQNVLLLSQWMANEGGLWADNPLNTSLDAARYPHQFTPAGVDTGIPIFPSMQSGIAATAKTLLGSPAYAKILKALQPGSTPCPAFATAVIRSPWASSHYGWDPGVFCGASPSGAIGHGRRGRGHGGAGAHHPAGGGHHVGRH